MLTIDNSEKIKLTEEFQMCSNEFDVNNLKTQLNMLPDIVAI